MLSLGKLCDENGYSHEWINGQKNTSHLSGIVVPGLTSSSSTSSSSLRTPFKQENLNKYHDKIYVVQDIDSVPSNIRSASREALLHVFEDNEVMKGKSPTMRHVSRTHRVALDWLFDRINLDSKIQIKYIDTKNQLADILTKGTSHVMNGIIC